MSRIIFAVLLVVAIISPAAVVFAVVWTAPPVTTPAVDGDTQGARSLPAPDIQPTTLPAPATERIRPGITHTRNAPRQPQAVSATAPPTTNPRALPTGMAR